MCITVTKCTPCLQYLVLLFLVGANCQGISDEVRQPPIIITPIQSDDIYVSSGSSFSVNCSAQGSPKPSYKWTQNGNILTPSSYISYDATTGTLTFSSFSTRDEATYMCVATNRFTKEDGSAYEVSSWSGRLRIWQEGVQFITAASITRTATEYDPLVLGCDPARAIGKVLLKSWYDDVGTRIPIDGDRLYVGDDGKLYFSYVLTTDTNPYGLTCGISTTDEKNIQLGQLYLLSIARRTPTAIRPQLMYSNSGVKALMIGSVRLECVFSGFDPMPPNSPLITWLDDAYQQMTNTTDGKYTITNHGHSLTITNLQEADEKNYTCRASNSAGVVTSSVFLNVTSAPIFIHGAPIDKTVPQGRDVVFSCETRSASGEINPGPPVWYINGNRVGSLDPGKYVFSSTRSELTVKSVTKANDIMCVQCESTNDVDTVLANSCLNVLDPITLTNEKDLVLNPSVVYGDLIKMTVLAITDPLMTLSYRWEFNNQVYMGSDAPPHMTYNSSTNEAYINTSTLTRDEYREIGGVYIRVVYHLYEERRVAFDVHLRDEGGTDGESSPTINGETAITITDRPETTTSSVSSNSRLSFFKSVVIVTLVLMSW